MTADDGCKGERETTSLWPFTGKPGRLSDNGVNQSRMKLSSVYCIMSWQSGLSDLLLATVARVIFLCEGCSRNCDGVLYHMFLDVPSSGLQKGLLEKLFWVHCVVSTEKRPGFIVSFQLTFLQPSTLIYTSSKK